MKRINKYMEFENQSYRKIINISLIAVIIFLSSCSLDEVIYDKPTTDGFIKTEADIPFVVNGVYSTYQEWGLYKSTGLTLLFYTGDDFCSSSVSYAGMYLNRSYNSSDKYIQNTWSNFFLAVDRANSAIKAINNSPLSAETKKRIEGEMRFMRGYTYFNLVRFFGGVPIKTEPTSPTGNFYATRNSVDQVYQQIFSDFQYANLNCLPYSKQPATEFGRATKGAAQAMLSLAYLTYGNYLDSNGKSDSAKINYQFAVNFSDSVINSNEYSLVTNYADLFDVTKEKNAYKEVIFGIQFTRDNLTSGAASRGSEFAFKLQPTTRFSICGNTPVGKGGGEAKLQPWFVEQYFNGDYLQGTDLDYRTQTSFLTTWQGSTSATSTTPTLTYVCFPGKPMAGNTIEKEPYLDKYKDSKGLDNRNHENDLFIIRLAEMYLIKAEALNELGNTTDAYTAFNMVRARARLANGTARTAPVDLASGLSKEDFRLAVFNERGLELVGEGHRFFDAVRMQYLNTGKSMLQYRMEIFYPSMTAAQKQLPYWNGSTWTGGRVEPVSISAWNDRYKLAPIPASEMLSNPNFGAQNPGW